MFKSFILTAAVGADANLYDTYGGLEGDLAVLAASEKAQELKAHAETKPKRFRPRKIVNKILGTHVPAHVKAQQEADKLASDLSKDQPRMSCNPMLQNEQSSLMPSDQDEVVQSSEDQETTTSEVQTSKRDSFESVDLTEDVDKKTKQSNIKKISKGIYSAGKGIYRALYPKKIRPDAEERKYLNKFERRRERIRNIRNRRKAAGCRNVPSRYGSKYD